MPAINPLFATKLFELTAIAYRDGIDCPALRDLNNWAMPQLADIGIMTIARTPAAARSTGNGTAGATLDDAVLTVLSETPAGLTAAEIQPMVSHLGYPKPALGNALQNLKRAGKAEKRGNSWFARSGRRGGTVSRKLTAGKAPPQQPAAAGAGEQRQAATG